ncbi:DUF3048 domain-containing protein [Actinomycetospora endophytica]|uniref:DUF3048 domain-containing protein n=1 Tax=Actinomycetospora endophytica TaxID=2291215 RepID=A0ABS8P549_9PSEU|nr:DUF3048 domain-containing protein [Actinomycetospora endophytica]MCD2193383.1 DUF3048 domain-containing protein [Actinomycetospora endophytica]
MAGERGGTEARTAIAVVIAVVIVVILGVVVWSSSGDSPAPLPPAPSPVAAKPAANLSPLTGGPDPGKAVLAVKVDNSPQGRPWTGVDAADVVYVEPVEGGVTRLLAVFASHLPPSVGPVRSFRESDIDVLAAYGRPALGFSGNAPELNQLVASSPVLPVSAEKVAGAYHRGRGEAPHNLYADPAALVKAAPGVAGPRDIGFRFGAAPAGGQPATDVKETIGSTPVDLHAADGRYTVAFDGQPAVTAGGPATVVVQRVPIRNSAVHDVVGAPSPTAVTVGRGAVDVLRDGKRWTGTWSRPDPNSPTSYTGADGKPLTFATGPVWVLLARG